MSWDGTDFREEAGKTSESAICRNCTRLKNELCMAQALLESIQQIFDGEEVSDFMLSFPIVRRATEEKQKDV